MKKLYSSILFLTLVLPLFAEQEVKPFIGANIGPSLLMRRTEYGGSSSRAVANGTLNLGLDLGQVIPEVAVSLYSKMDDNGIKTKDMYSGMFNIYYRVGQNDATNVYLGTGVGLTSYKTVVNSVTPAFSTTSSSNVTLGLYLGWISEVSQRVSSSFFIRYNYIDGGQGNSINIMGINLGILFKL